MVYYKMKNVILKQTVDTLKSENHCGSEILAFVNSQYEIEISKSTQLELEVEELTSRLSAADEEKKRVVEELTSRLSAAEEEKKREVEELTLRLSAADEEKKREVEELTLRLSNAKALCAKYEGKMIKAKSKYAASVAESRTSCETAQHLVIQKFRETLDKFESEIYSEPLDFEENIYAVGVFDERRTAQDTLRLDEFYAGTFLQETFQHDPVPNNKICNRATVCLNLYKENIHEKLQQYIQIRETEGSGDDERVNFYISDDIVTVDEMLTSLRGMPDSSKTEEKERIVAIVENIVSSCRNYHGDEDTFPLLSLSDIGIDSANSVVLLPPSNHSQNATFDTCMTKIVDKVMELIKLRGTKGLKKKLSSLLIK
jgi:hypothetical protein